MILAILVVLASCSGKDGKKNVQPSVPASLPIAEAIVDQSGGVIEDTKSGFRMEIPPGALQQVTKITVTSPRSSSSPTNVSVVEIEPAGLVFTVDVLLALPFAQAQIQNGDRLEDLIVIKEGTGGIEIDDNPTLNTVRGVVETTTKHLSRFTTAFVRDYKLFNQQHRFFDGTQMGYIIVATRTSITPPFVKTELHPLLIDDVSGMTTIPGKGTWHDFLNGAEGNVIYIHGLMGNPGDSLFNDQGQPNDNDIIAELRKNPKVKNLLLFQYPSGWPIPFNARALTDMIVKHASPNCRFTIIAHSMGGLLARYAIEKLNLSPYVDRLITLGTPHEGGMMPQLSAYVKDTHIASLLFLGIVPGVSDVLAGGTFLTDLNTNFPGNKLPTTEYFLVAGTLIDPQGNPTGNDGFVDFSSAKSTHLGVPQNYILVAAQDHGQLPHNARNNTVWIKTREWDNLGTAPFNLPPTVNAGQDQTLTVNTTVTLTGIATDPDSDPVIKTEWKQTGGSQQVTLANANTTTATFTPTQVGTYTFTLTVSDTDKTGTDTVTITVIPPPIQRRIFEPTYDAYNAYTSSSTTPYVFDTYPMLVVGIGGSYEFTSEITFANALATIPQGATIISAHFDLVRRQVWRSGGIIDVRGYNNTFLGQIDAGILLPGIDVTDDVRAALQSNASPSFLLKSTTAYLEYHASESAGQEPTLTIEWQ